MQDLAPNPAESLAAGDKQLRIALKRSYDAHLSANGGMSLVCQRQAHSRIAGENTQRSDRLFARGAGLKCLILGRRMPAKDELTLCERRLVEAAGTLVDVRERDPARDDVARCKHWEAERLVRAGFLRDLLTDPARGSRVLRLRGARITGALDLEGDDLACGIVLQDCGLDEPVNLRQARVPVLRFLGCHMPSLEAVQLEARGNLILDRITATSVDVRGAQIAGFLSLDGAILTYPVAQPWTAARSPSARA